MRDDVRALVGTLLTLVVGALIWYALWTWLRA
jgi:hypothetical protein